MRRIPKMSLEMKKHILIHTNSIKFDFSKNEKGEIKVKLFIHGLQVLTSQFD